MLQLPLHFLLYYIHPLKLTKVFHYNAFQQFSEGFEHRGNPDNFSAAVNKYLRIHKLKPTEQHSIYSLRHTFKDRLRDIEAPEEIIDGLMGHKKSGPKYGRGHKLETKQKWMKKIAFTL